jgi:hypothetical protein
MGVLAPCGIWDQGGAVILGVGGMIMFVLNVDVWLSSVLCTQSSPMKVKMPNPPDLDGTEVGMMIGAMMMIGQRLRGIDLEQLQAKIEYMLEAGPITDPEIIKRNGSIFEVIKEMLPHALAIKEVFEDALESGKLDTII